MKIRSKFIMNIVFLIIFLLFDLVILIIRIKYITTIKTDETTIYQTNKEITEFLGMDNYSNFKDDFNELKEYYLSYEFQDYYPQLKVIENEFINIEKNIGLKDAINRDNIIRDSLTQISVNLLDLSYKIDLNAKGTGNLLNYIFYLSLVILIITIVNFANIGKSVILSVGRLVKGIDRIKEGILNEKIVLKGKDEFKDLAGCINDMTWKLQKSYNDLQDEIKIRTEKEKVIVSSEKRYRSFFEMNNVVMLLTDCEKGRILDANPSAIRYFGFSKEDLVNKNIYDINIIDNDEMLNNLYEKTQVDENHYFLKQKNSKGEIRYVEIFQTPVIIEEKKMFLSIIFDITEKLVTENKLEHSMENYRLLFDNVNDAIFVYTLDKNHKPSRFINVNDVACRISGIDRDELLKMNIFDIHPEAFFRKITGDISSILDQGQLITETLFKNKDGRFIPVEINSNLITLDEKKTVIAIVHDISDRKKREELLVKSRDEYLKILNDFPNPIIKSNEFKQYDYFNASWFEFTGRTPGKELGIGWEEIIHDEDKKRFDTVYEYSFKNRDPFNIEIRIKHSEGTYRWVSVNGIPFYNMEGEFRGYISSCYDINYIKISNERIKKSLNEKDLLIKEIHHRVKNNLQIIQSLLNLQMSKIQSEETREIIRVNQDRIKSMALIHESIYQSNDFTNIDLENYIRYICLYLMQTYGINTDRIKVDIKVKKVFLNIDISIPLGMIINELISNSLRHSFASTDEGEIELEIKPVSGKKYSMILSDNGKEFSERSSVNNPASFGYILINNLLKQLNGKMDIERNDGKNIIRTEFEDK